MNELMSILDELAEGREEDEPSVLATVVRVVGSAYRGIGARCLIERDGRAIGLVSGGCLEADLARQAWRLTEGGQAALIRYDSTSPNGEWAFGLGCRGTIDILLERVVGPRPAAWVEFLRARLDRHEPAVLARVLRAGPGRTRGRRLGAFLALGRDGADRSTISARPSLAAEVAGASARAALDAKAGRGTSAWPGRATASRPSSNWVEPPPTLIVCGSGPGCPARWSGSPASSAGTSRSSTAEGGRTTRGRFAAGRRGRDPGRRRPPPGPGRPPPGGGRGDDAQRHRGREVPGTPARRPPLGYVGLLGPGHRAARLLERLGCRSSAPAQGPAPRPGRLGPRCRDARRDRPGDRRRGPGDPLGPVGKLAPRPSRADPPTRVDPLILPEIDVSR